MQEMRLEAGIGIEPELTLTQYKNKPEILSTST